jgi:nitroreductase
MGDIVDTRETNETLRSILGRRSIRAYQELQIPRESLDEILLAGQHAPSGGNCQFSHITVIQNRDVLEDLKRIATQEFSRMEVTDGMYKSMASAISRAKAGGFDFLYQAPTLVIVSNLKSHPNAMADSSAAIENMMVYAASIDIGSCWINQFRWLSDNAGLRAYVSPLGIGTDEVICGGLVLGSPRARPSVPLARTGNRITMIP